MSIITRFIRSNSDVGCYCSIKLVLQALQFTRQGRYFGIGIGDSLMRYATLPRLSGEVSSWIKP